MQPAVVIHDYDVIVLGGGAPGEHCAGALAEGGLRVAVVERDLVGGLCSYWACIPSKTLLRPGEAVHGAREAAASAEVDVQAALAWRDSVVNGYSDEGQERWLAERGIDLLRGRGRLDGVGAVTVDGTRFTADQVVLANGADPFVPPVNGLGELDGVSGTNEATAMRAVPARLVVLGGGPAGSELGQAAHRLGADVVIVESADRLLPREPAPVGDALVQALRRDGIEVIVGRQATDARREGVDFVLSVYDGRDVRGDRLLVATGRRPRVADIGLETVGIAQDPHRVPVDDRLCAGERLWAVGDVTGIWQLTHVGEYQGEIVASNILGDARSAHYEAVPRVTYTDPRAASVGATEDRFSGTAQLSDVARTATYTRAHADVGGFLTLLSDGQRLTGAYGVGPEAGEWMQQITLAIRARVPLEILRDTIQPFPSFSDIVAAAAKALRHTIATPSAGEPGGFGRRLTMSAGTHPGSNRSSWCCAAARRAALIAATIDQEMVLADFIVSDDVERSRRFCTDVLGGRTVVSREEGDDELTDVALANSWIIINVSGGATDHKPTVTLETPPDPDPVGSFLNIRVAHIESLYAEWSERGAKFLTRPRNHATEIRCYIRDPDGYVIEMGQTTLARGWRPPC